MEEGRGGGERWEEGKRERRGEEERKVHSTTNICMYVNMNKIHMKVHMHILYVCMYVRACMYTSSMCSGGASQVGEGRCANVSTCRSTYVRTYVYMHVCECYGTHTLSGMAEAGGRTTPQCSPYTSCSSSPPLGGRGGA